MAMTKWKSAKERKIVPSMTDEERRSQRQSPSPAKMVGLRNANLQQRWNYFLNEICGQEEIWTTFAPDSAPGGWFDESSGVDYLPVWPNQAFADWFLSYKEAGWSLIPVPISDWIDEISPSLLKAEFQLAIFPFEEGDFDVMVPSELDDAIELHWKKFAKYQVEFGGKMIRKTFGLE